MYPSSGVDYYQSVTQPLGLPKHYYRRYNACNPCDTLIGQPLTCLSLTGYFPPSFVRTVDPVAGNINDPVQVNGSNLVSSGNIGEGDEAITLAFVPCGTISTSSNIDLIMGIQQTKISSVELYYCFRTENNIPIWTITGGKIDFNSPNTTT